jgi:hypothetical protein
MSPMPAIGHPEWLAGEAVPPEPPVTVSNQVTVSRFSVPDLWNKNTRTSIRNSSPANSPSISSGPNSLLPLRKISPSSATQLFELVSRQKSCGQNNVFMYGGCDRWLTDQWVNKDHHPLPALRRARSHPNLNPVLRSHEGSAPV